MMKHVLTLLAAFLIGATPVAAQDSQPLKIIVDQGVIEPLPFAVPDFVAGSSASAEYARNIARVVSADLSGTGLFREIPSNAYISQITSFSSPVQFADWKAINAEALVTGFVNVDASGKLVVQFRVYDVFAGQEMSQGLQFVGTPDGWRRMAHKVADEVYKRITGEGAYFDSRVVFVSETGPKNQREKRLAIMDYDGANVSYLTDSSSIVLAPRFSPSGSQVLYTSYESGFPRINVLDVSNVARRALEGQDGTMSFAPRFAPDGRTVVYSLTRGGNTDLYTMDINTGASQRLTNAPSIETAPSFSPDGSQIVFESDRSGTPQLYVMSSGGGEATRISFGKGRYGTPVWSPRGDYIAFTKQSKGRFHIGVMRTNGSEERLLTASFLDEGPTWAPNGRVIMFTRETAGASGASSLWSVDITGRNLRQVATNTGASDPAWSPLQN
ncbi:translocation protein TolB [Roseovarius albus]|uniref:Tol-Pal system protein TolB n=1 Tax=Roseovarius albus TaxID=1247867 RepID=A0A1X6YFU7_9RHOB|nr:Tol-Pal system beta propeller repeat protein TolB [Roseovarius albus]SLN19893.1 translocation protein TolB [Roseovarius albus]